MTLTLTGAPVLYEGAAHIVLFPFLDKEGQTYLTTKKARKKHGLREGFFNVHENSDGHYTAIHTGLPVDSRKKANKEVREHAAFYAEAGHRYRCRYRIRVRLK